MTDSTIEKYTGIASYTGFQKWVRLSLEDAPMIRPPRRHMLSNVTGGLEQLYKLIRDSNEEGKKSSDDESSRKQRTEHNKGRQDDEGGGKKQPDKSEVVSDEETSPYTDDEGEFCPEPSMPLLAARYKFVEVLAKGQSALIIKALDTYAKDKAVAIKALHRVYKPIGSQEADILLELHRADPWLHVPFARLQNQFVYGPHYCLVFEFLSPTPLYSHYEQRQIKGNVSLPHIKFLCVKLLTVLGFLHKQNVIHADLKPENILLKNEDDTSSVMVIDFGNALRNLEDELSLYYTDFELQTLLYRAPEVIFGLKFSLEIDMWSLGCLLAECYIGKPLFMGKTKYDILSKITKLLGPFPKHFADGECADEFQEFIGKPLTKFQRIENLRKRLVECKDINFLLMLESLLAYIPEKRFNPFDAAVHPFVANVSPYLYLSSFKECVKYPTVCLDKTTYPFLPDLPKDDSSNVVAADGRKRLQSYASAPSHNSNKSDEPLPATEVPHNATASHLPNLIAPTPIVSTPSAVFKSSTTVITSKGKTEEGDDKDKQISDDERSAAKSDQESDESKKENDMTEHNSEKMRNDKHPDDSENGAKRNSLSEDDDIVSVVSEHLAPKNRAKGKANPNVSRTDVKETLKSMGLRCEDFTISVYSREQAHAILRKQGVEVTNHLPTKSPQKGNSPRSGLSRGSISRPRFDSRLRYTAPIPSSLPSKNKPNPQPPSQDEDDDCIILDPPDGPPVKPPPPTRRYPQQFQLMGTTVQVNRGAKRSMRGVPMHTPMSKRPNNRQMTQRGYRNVSQGYYDDTSELSVQDTLKRLKNYNISITCRKNAAQGRAAMISPDRQGMIESDSELDADVPPFDSDEEDMAKYLECEIDEEEKLAEEEEMMDYESSEIADTSIEEVNLDESSTSPTKVANNTKEENSKDSNEAENETAYDEQANEDGEEDREESEMDKDMPDDKDEEGSADNEYMENEDEQYLNEMNDKSGETLEKSEMEDVDKCMEEDAEKSNEENEVEEETANIECEGNQEKKENEICHSLMATKTHQDEKEDIDDKSEDNEAFEGDKEHDVEAKGMEQNICSDEDDIANASNVENVAKKNEESELIGEKICIEELLSQSIEENLGPKESTKNEDVVKDGNRNTDMEDEEEINEEMENELLKGDDIEGDFDNEDLETLGLEA